jgi:hypothetical protein
MNSTPAFTSAVSNASRSAVGGCCTCEPFQHGRATARASQPLDDRELEAPLDQRLIDLRDSPRESLIFSLHVTEFAELSGSAQAGGLGLSVLAVLSQ